MSQLSIATHSSLPTIADKRRLGYVGNASLRDSDSWYTPENYVNAARKVMGGIDLDPFSNARANEVIKASRFFDIHTSAFNHPWRRHKREAPLKVWMNPPYSAQVINRAITLFITQLKAGYIEQAVVLTNNATETRWFSSLREHCFAACFTDHRIAFESHDSKRVSGNTRGQVFFYFCGSAHESHAPIFCEVFSDFGWCVSKTRGWQ